MRVKRARLAPFLAACAVLWPSPTPAQSQCANPTAQVVRIANRVEHRVATTTTFVPATLNLNVCEGDSIRAGDRSRATIAFLDRSVVLTIEQNTEWVVRRPSVPGGSLIELIRGAILFFTRQPLEIQTPFVNANVEGTEFLVRVESDRTLITVFEGRVQATNPLGSLTLTNNQSAIAAKGQAPQLQVIVRPRDAVQWALYYQPILADDSLEKLEQIPEGKRDARFYVRRSALLLKVGRLDEARADIKQALSRDPNDGEAYALSAVIAVALNDRAEALSNGREAVKRSPKSAASRIALSYALQANFELEAARDELLQAVVDQPSDARAWARLAELWLSLGYLDRAQEAAEKAASLAPAEARASTVLGFAALARIDTTAARTAFERAIALESDSPLARLGLGLAKIRRGDLEGGRRDVEIAAALSPDDPIVRSYLGKAYFEEKREPLPGAQFELAKQLDPNDPTPWFYDAIRKQTINRPVEALQDLQRSIELNDNRAVYRSRLLLDQDLAARSAGLGRIYSDLGFEQLALVEGWNSVNSDAADYSGHRFLADMYSALPRHEIARVSELLQSQLLQPININAVQPQLAEANPSILAGSGPGGAAFNEFNPLFNRNRLSLLASGAVGGNDTFGDEVVVSGVWNQVSFSAGQYHFDSDGFRENNGQDRDIFNAFVQASLAPSTSVQGEVRSTDHLRGDLHLRFHPGEARPFRRQATGLDSARLGLHHVFGPRSDVIASFIYGRFNDQFDDNLLELGFPGNPGSSAVDVDIQGWTTEVQHLYRSKRVRLVSGLGHFQANRDEAIDLGFRIPVPPFAIPFSERNEFELNHTNLYVYSQIDVAERVTLSLGSSGDFLNGRGIEADQFNPKAGVSWQPTPATTVRAAGFRTLNRPLISNQTIEPTQVAGFNQLFDGVEGEAAWRYGLGIDQKVSRMLYAGAELSWRDLEHPSVTLQRGVPVRVTKDDWNERLGRAYLYSTPHPRLGLSLEYLFERFERVGNLGEDQIANLSTHRIPIGMAYFHPTGLIGRVMGTIVRQEGILGTTNGPRLPGEDTFGVVDGSIGYRMPRRYGLITLGVKNLFEQQFLFQDTDPKFPRILPGRLVVLRFTVTL